MSITPAQCRAARGLINWSQLQLAAASGIGPFSVRQFEKGAPGQKPEAAAAIAQTLEAAGVEFTAETNDEVRLRHGSTAAMALDLMTSELVAARLLLGWSQTRVALTAGINTTTLCKFETGARPLSETARSALRAALESAGVEFVAEHGGGAGVRLRKSTV